MKTRHMSPGLVAAKTGEAGRQLVTRGRAEWFEPGREQFRAVEAGPHEPCRLMACVSKEIVPYLVGRDPPDDPGSLEHLHPRRQCGRAWRTNWRMAPIDTVNSGSGTPPTKRIAPRAHRPPAAEPLTGSSVSTSRRAVRGSTVTIIEARVVEPSAPYVLRVQSL